MKAGTGARANGGTGARGHGGTGARGHGGTGARGHGGTEARGHGGASPLGCGAALRFGAACSLPGGRRGRAASLLRRAALAALLVAAIVPAARAQKAQWSDAVYVPGRWQAGRLVAARTSNAATDSLALVMRVDYFAQAPRWRAEIVRTGDGRTFGEPVVLLGNGAQVMVVTPLGATPLERHALSGDSLVRAAIVFDAGGQRQGAASGRIVTRSAAGAVARVAYRRPVRNPTFDAAMLDPRNRTAGRNFLAARLTAVGDQRSAGVVATAGARGVDRVQTPRGEVPVTPDSAAIKRMEQFRVSPMALEDFLRRGGLGPYAARPEEGQVRQ